LGIKKETITLFNQKNLLEKEKKQQRRKNKKARFVFLPA